MKESCPHVLEGSDYILWFKHLPTPALLISTMFPHTNSQDPPYALFGLHLQMLTMRAWSFFGLLKSGTASGEEIASGWHERTQSPWQRFDLFLGGCQACSAYGDRVVRLMTGGRWTGSDLSLSLPSADPESCFDWISHELMRQAWRKASVVEISYHILICSLCEWCMRLCDLKHKILLLLIMTNKLYNKMAKQNNLLLDDACPSIIRGLFIFKY